MGTGVLLLWSRAAQAELSAEAAASRIGEPSGEPGPAS
jgi:hypothetical protein